MDLYEAVTHAFATMATGGFSPNNTSIGHYNSLYVENVIVVFMFLAGTNFVLQYRVFLQGKIRELVTSSEFRLYVSLAVVFTILITLSLMQTPGSPGAGKSLRSAGFHAVSILTTTGFTNHPPPPETDSADTDAPGDDDTPVPETPVPEKPFDSWPTFSMLLLVILMTIGGCAGSTAGGLKVIRLVVVFKHAAREFQRLLHPRLVRPVTVNRKAIDEEALWGILGFFLLYMMAFVGATIVLTALEHEIHLDLVTAATASLSALNSIGPGLGNVGPAENFAFLHPTAKLTLSFCMLLGRLEIYTLLILFLPRFWSRG